MKIDFYILEQLNRSQSLLFVCKLIEKCYLQQEKIFVCPATALEGKELDQLLWTYQDDRFVPHHLDHPETNCMCPIHIGQGNLPHAFQGVLVNLQAELPSTLAYSRLVEIVFFEPAMQQLARERYKTYRALGHQLMTYKINKSDL